MNALNWKRTWAAVTLLAAARGPEATLLAAQPEIQPPPPAAAPRPVAPPAAQAEPAPGVPVPPPPSVAAPPPVAPADATAAAEAFRRRYGLAPVAAPAQRRIAQTRSRKNRREFFDQSQFPAGCSHRRNGSGDRPAGGNAWRGAGHVQCPHQVQSPVAKRIDEGCVGCHRHGGRSSYRV